MTQHFRRNILLLRHPPCKFYLYLSILGMEKNQQRQNLERGGNPDVVSDDRSIRK